MGALPHRKAPPLPLAEIAWQSVLEEGNCALYPPSSKSHSKRADVEVCWLIARGRKGFLNYFSIGHANKVGSNIPSKLITAVQSK